MTPKCPDCKRDQDDCICASPASAPKGKALWDSVYKTLRNYRMTMMVNSDGDGYPLIDAMSPEQGTVESGIEECTYLADAIYNDLLAAAPTTPNTEDLNKLELYGELLYAVANKFPGESRHQTALRYIRNAEKGSDNATTQEDKP